MTSNHLIKVLCLLSLLCAQASFASAGCLVRDVETTPGQLQSYFVCENSLSSPEYTISSYMGTKISFSLFSFDKKGSGYLCHDYENKDESEMQCTQSGIRRLSSVFKAKESSIHMLDIARTSGQGKAAQLFTQAARFSTADSLAAAAIDGCFVRVHGTDVYFGYESERFNLLANCLIRFEGEIAKNKKLLSGLL